MLDGGESFSKALRGGLKAIVAFTQWSTDGEEKIVVRTFSSGR